MPEVSGWLVPGFIRALHALGVDNETSAQIEAHRLLNIWSTPERLFHNAKHLADILSSLDEQSSNVHEPAVLVAAAWYHGAVTYDPEARTLGRLFNYSAAADRAITALTELGASHQAAARVGEIILMLTDLEAPADDIDACVFVAAVMSYLGVVPQRYREIRKMLRAEITSLDDRMYYRQRRAYVRKLLEHEELFRSPLAREYEDQARQNLTGELAQLNAMFPDEAAVTTSIRSEKKGSPVFRAKSMRPVARKSIIQKNPNTGTNPIVPAATTGSIPVITQPPANLSWTIPQVAVASSNEQKSFPSRGEQATPAGLPVLKSTITSGLKPISTPIPTIPDPSQEKILSSVEEKNSAELLAEEEQSTLESVADVLTTLTMKKMTLSSNTGSFPVSNRSPHSSSTSIMNTLNSKDIDEETTAEQIPDESEIDVLPVSIDEEDI